MPAGNKEMKTKRDNWPKNPSRNQVLFISALWVIGNLLIILSMTDLFSESIFQRRYFLLYLLILVSTLATLKIIISYFKST